LSPQKPRSKKGKKSKSSSGHAGAEAGDYVRVKLPNKKKGEIFGIADQLLGASHIKVM
jgi:hypothetical protein